MLVRLLVGRAGLPSAGESRAWLRSCSRRPGSGPVTKSGGDLVGGFDGHTRHGLDLFGSVLDEQGGDADAVLHRAGVGPDGCRDAAQTDHVLLAVQGVAEPANVRDLG